jgi:hypothetical protein
MIERSASASQTEGGPTMLRRNRFAAICIGILGLMATPAWGETRFSSTGIKVRQTWIVGLTNLTLKEAPASKMIDNQEGFAKLWKAWRTDELPKVDFAKEIVLVLTCAENAQVNIQATLRDNGDLAIKIVSTERVSAGNSYVLAIVEKNGIKRVVP